MKKFLSSLVEPGRVAVDLSPAPSDAGAFLGKLPMILVEGVAAACGMAGALLLATEYDPAWGFGAFLASNIGWLTFGVARRHWGLVVQQAVFLLASLIGLWNFWLGPLVLG